MRPSVSQHIMLELFLLDTPILSQCVGGHPSPVWLLVGMGVLANLRQIALLVREVRLWLLCHRNPDHKDCSRNSEH
jgi:hypothetical protein